MFYDPLQQLLVSHAAGGNTQAGLHNIFVAAVQADSVDLQEGQHHIHSDALVAIHKGVVGDQV